VGTREASHLIARGAGSVLLVVLLARAAAAEPGVATDEWPVPSTGKLALDGGLAVGPSLTLGTGMATGLSAGLAYGQRFAFGVRASWATATESSLVWAVTHDDYRLRATAAVRAAAGRGAFALRLGVGGTLVHEARTRVHGARAGLPEAELSSSAFALLPAADLDAVVSVHVLGPWMLVLAAGPSALFTADGALHGGWTAQMGVGWQP
jgi:hypothetical protein